MKEVIRGTSAFLQQGVHLGKSQVRMRGTRQKMEKRVQDRADH